MSKLVELFFLFKNASQITQRPTTTIIAECLRLRFSPRRLGVSEYFDFCLFRDDLSFLEKLEFGGYRDQATLEELLVDDYSKILSIDKVTMYGLFKGLGLPFPETRGVYGRCVPEGFCRTLPSIAYLVQFLRIPDTLPVYMKPAFGSYGRGNLLIECAKEDGFLLGDGSTVSSEKLAELLPNPSGLGWILQEPLQSHSEIATHCGRKISSVRVHTFLTTKGPVISKVVWKINVGNQDSDNFCDGQSGNMAAEIDPSTGAVLRVINGVGFSYSATDQNTQSEALIRAKKLCGFKLPCWEDVRAVALEAALAFPGYINPGWDIAICDDGPKILEVNYFGDLDFPQYSHRQGYLSKEFIQQMQDRNLAKYLGHHPIWRRKCKNNGRFGDRKCHWPW